MNIILIGMPGVGKSTIGVVLAKTLGMHFVDTDIVIQEREKQLLQDIIRENGIEAFLQAEEGAILSLEGDHQIIATGGSVVYKERAMAQLKAMGKVVYLYQPLKTIEKRIRNIKTRGIAMEKGQTLKDIYEERIVLYEKYADVTISCKGMSVEEIIAKLIQVLALEMDQS